MSDLKNVAQAFPWSYFQEEDPMLFRDRSDAGKFLANQLTEYAHHPEAIVLALPRGCVPVGYEIATALDIPLDVFLVRKLGFPGQEELAMGAISTGGAIVLNEDIVTKLQIPNEIIAAVVARELRELERREEVYREGRMPLEVQQKIVILVDDGMATGATMRAAALALKLQHAGKIIVAVPVAAAESCENLKKEVDRVTCGKAPEPFFGVGYWYSDFTQNTDEEVIELLSRTRQPTHT